MAQQTIVQESNTKSGDNYLDGFFSTVPFDARFNHIEYRKVVPVSAISKNSTQFDFTLDRLDSPQCVMIGDILVDMKLTITKEDEVNVPDKTKFVAPANSCLHSLFSKVIVKIGGQQISNTPDFYNYRSYLKHLLTFDPEVKAASMQSFGWAVDASTCMNADLNSTNTPLNNGFTTRNSFFRRNLKYSGTDCDYKPEGAHFIGRLDHELAGCGKPLPPLTPVHIQLHRAADDFYLMKNKDDTEKYRAIVTSLNLFVPVAFVQKELMDQFIARWPKEPVHYNFRRHSIMTLSVPRNKLEYYSDKLFPESENPVRVYFFIVDSEAERGSMIKNPFEFRRKWTGKYDKASGIELQQRLEMSRLEQKIELQSRKSEKMLENFLERFLQSQRRAERVSDPEDEPLATSKGKAPVSRMRTRAAGNTAQNLPPAQASGSSQFAATTDPVSEDDEEEEEMTSSQSFLSKLGQLFGGRKNSDASDHSDIVVIPTSEQLERARMELDKLERQVLNRSSAGSNRGDGDNVSVASSHRRPQNLLADSVPATPLVTAESSFWLTKCQLELNSQPVG